MRIIELGVPAVADPYVRAWQRVVGIPGPKCDGKFGPGTDGAVHAWQASRGVLQDGVVGEATRAALEPGDLIKPYEGLVLRAYDDAQDVHLSERFLKFEGGTWRRLDGTPCRKNPTIGWGRRLWPGEVVLTCTRAEADLWFNLHINDIVMPSVRRLGVVEHGRVAALASFAYNCGTGALAKLAAHGYKDWVSYDHVGSVEDVGLRTRREEELAMWDALEAA